MTRFFIPQHEPDHAATERTYQSIRHQAESETGRIAQRRRIYGLTCRRNGVDRSLRVGDIDTDAAGRTVLAIVQLSGGQYTIHHDACTSSESPVVVLPRSAVYTVTEFV